LHENYADALKYYKFSNTFPGNILISVKKWQLTEKKWLSQLDRAVVVVEEMKNRIAGDIASEQVFVCENCPEIVSFQGEKNDNKIVWENVFDQTKRLLRLQQKSVSTEKTYLHWIKRFALFYEAKRPDDVDGEAFKNFLSFLAVERRVGAATQNQAFNALLYLYRKVLCIDIGDVSDTVRAREKNGCLLY